jgi:hypothetical protein
MQGMSSPSTNHVILNMAETHQATISINASHLHQVIKARSSPSSDQGKVISIMSKTHGSKASYGMGSNHMHQ